MKENSISRRSFLKSSAFAGAAGTIGTGSILTGCKGNNDAVKNTPLKAPGSYYVPELMDKANDGRELKAGVIGCGGRGTGAAVNFLNAANGVTVTALGDTYKDRLDRCANTLKERFNIDIPEDKRFIGIEAYKQVIDSYVDMVIVCTPPFFRPAHFQYAVEKGKHAFLEKPLFVDAVGYRSIMATARQAEAKDLCVITGTQRHHQRNYVESYKLIMDGIIGAITGGVVYWNQNQLWFRPRQQGWSDFEWMVRDWVNWTWLSGDHIVEQHVHNLDVFTWFSGLRPEKAIGFGSRHRRVTGNQYDNFSVDFVMENGIHMHSMCRQINGCSGPIMEFIQGAKGSWSTIGRETVIKDLSGNELWKFDVEAENATYQQTDPFTLEHVNWVNHVRAGIPINQAQDTAISNMAALMGRESAYTGTEVTWNQMTTSPMDLTPPDLNFTGKMDLGRYEIPVPGISNEEQAARNAARSAQQSQ